MQNFLNLLLSYQRERFHKDRRGRARDVAAAPQTPQLGGGPGQLWGPKLV